MSDSTGRNKPWDFSLERERSKLWSLLVGFEILQVQIANLISTGRMYNRILICTLTYPCIYVWVYLHMCVSVCMCLSLIFSPKLSHNCHTVEDDYAAMPALCMISAVFLSWPCALWRDVKIQALTLSCTLYRYYQENSIQTVQCTLLTYCQPNGNGSGYRYSVA